MNRMLEFLKSVWLNSERAKPIIPGEEENVKEFQRKGLDKPTKEFPLGAPKDYDEDADDMLYKIQISNTTKMHFKELYPSWNPTLDESLFNHTRSEVMRLRNDVDLRRFIKDDQSEIYILIRNDGKHVAEATIPFGTAKKAKESGKYNLHHRLAVGMVAKAMEKGMLE